MKVLITGGAGFIGSNLALKLKNKGYSVRVLDNLSPQIHSENPDQSYTYNLIKNKVEFIKGDVINLDDWKQAIDGVDIIVHLAAETGTGQSMYEIDKYVTVNVGGTAKLLEVLTNEKHQVKKLVLASSRAVYGEGKYLCQEHGIVYPFSRINADLMSGDFEVKCPYCDISVKMLPTDEESKLHPTSVYGFTKQAQEQLYMIVCHSIGLPVVIFRFQNVYGPGQSLKNPYTGILSRFSSVAKGTIIQLGVVITCNVHIEEGCLINNHVVIGHDVTIGKYSVISPNATIGGNVKIGSSCYIGSGAVIRNGITVGENSIIGMGAVVLHDVAPNSVMVGNPARLLRENVDKKVFK